MTREMTPFRQPLWWFFLGALGMSAVVAYDMALPVGVGAVLGYITERRVDWVFGRIRKPDNARWRGILSAAFIVLVLVVVFLPISLAVYLALTDLLKLLGHLDWNDLNDKLEHLGPVVAERLQKLGVDVSFDQIRSKAIELVTSKAGAAGGIIAGLLSATPNVLFNTLIIVIGWYVFATEGKAGREEVLPRLIPWARPRQILRETTSEVIESVIIANILVSAVQSMICAVPLMVLRVPRALVWSLLAFFLSFIPIVGTVPITFGAALWCYSQGRTGGAIAMVVVGLFVGSVDNVLRPLFMRSSKSAELSTLWLLVALTSGVSAFGLSGVILGPLAFALFVAYTRALEPPPVVPATLAPAHVADPSVEGPISS
ncbi:MAG: AI-2E family transporter, partial [Myxococcales bacterium]